MQCLKIMKTNGHDHGAEIQPQCAGIERRNCGSDTQGQQGDYRKILLPDINHHQDCSKCQEAWNLSQTLEYTYLFTGKRSLFDGKIVERRALTR